MSRYPSLCRSPFIPGVLALVLGLAVLSWAWVRAEGRVPSLFYVGGPDSQAGWTGYDGQFVYTLAQDLDPQRARQRLDVPAYRYQRILVPLLAYLLARGSDLGILLVVWGSGAVAHLLATVLWARWMREQGWGTCWALLYAAWPGLLAAWRLGLPEPVMYGLAVSSFLWALQGRSQAAWAALLAAVLTKELALAFLPAIALALHQQGQGREALRLSLGVVLPWLAWQGWLWRTFGHWGLATGGWGSTPMPLYPLGGLIQAAWTLPRTWFLAYLLLLTPSFLLPMALSLLWLRQDLRHRRLSPWHGLLLPHLALMLWLPMSSWEPLAVIRLSPGFLLAFWSLALQHGAEAWLRRLFPFWALWFFWVLAR